MMTDPVIKRKSSFPAFNIALGKTLAAAAWVDGELNEQELSCLKNIILRLPGITFEDWRKLKIYLAYPVSKPEQLTITEQFSEQVYLTEHRKSAWTAMLEVIRADGGINTEEKAFVEEIDSALADNAESFLRKLKFFFFKDNIKAQNAWPTDKDQSGRDRFIHEFFDNPIYFLFRKALLKKEIAVPQSKPEMQKVCLYSAILCWLANADSKISLPEMRVIRNILIDTCGLSEEIARCIQEVSFAIDVNELQLRDLTASLRVITQSMERNELFSAMSRLVIVDNEITDEELESLRTIAVYLEISQTVWINTFQKIVIKTSHPM